MAALGPFDRGALAPLEIRIGPLCKEYICAHRRHRRAEAFTEWPVITLRELRCPIWKGKVRRDVDCFRRIASRCRHLKGRRR